MSIFIDNLLNGKTVLITGGATGLGKAMSIEFGSLGARIAIVSRKKENLEAALLISLGFQVYPADGFWTSLPVNYFPSPFGFLGFAVSAQIRISAFSSILNVLFVIVLIAGIILWVFKSTYAPVVTFCFSIFAWIIYQGLGIVAQFSTDSNTGLVLAILMVAYMLNNQEIKASGKKTRSLEASAAGGM